MKSFGLWYLANNSEGDISEAGSSLAGNDGIEAAAGETEKPEFDLHVNFWSLEDYRHTDSRETPCLDIGIKIRRYKVINKLTFFCPFIVDENDIKDLADKMTVKSNANIIFNADCEIQTKDNYTIIELEKEKLLVFPLDQAIKDVYSMKKGEYRTDLEFKFQDFQKYVNSNKELDELDVIYIRFRIRGDALANNIYFDSRPLNKSFESAFSGTRMIDFKINEKRNIEERVRAEIIVKREEVVDFRKVHFLVVEPSAYDVSSFDDLDMSCRELEEGLWDDYLGVKINFDKGRILAYHWRTKDDPGSFSCLVKVNYSKTKVSTISVYAMLVIVLGMISSAVVTAINILWPNNLNAMVGCIIIGVFLVFVGIFIGKRPK